MVFGRISQSRKDLACRRLCQTSLIFTALLIANVACMEPIPRNNRARIQYEEPSVRIKAIVEAGRMRDELAVPLIVDRLEDEDEGVRLYAIIALEKITGERFGYDYADTMAERAIAVDRWRNFVRQRVAQSTNSDAKVMPGAVTGSQGLPGAP